MSQDLAFDRASDALDSFDAYDDDAERSDDADVFDQPGARSGAELQFERIYRENFEYVFACLRRLGAPAEVVEDAVQDVFVVAYRRLDDFEGRSSVRTWLYAIARRVASDHRRSAGRRGRRRAALAREPAAPGGTPDDAVRAREAAETIDEFLDTLDPARREVFVLSELEGLSGPEIVERTGAKLNTVYSRLRTARKAFEAHCARLAADAERLVQAEGRARSPEGAERRAWAAIVPVAFPGAPVVGTIGGGGGGWAASGGSATGGGSLVGSTASTTVLAKVGVFAATVTLGTAGLWVVKTTVLDREAGASRANPVVVGSGAAAGPKLERRVAAPTRTPEPPRVDEPVVEAPPAPSTLQGAEPGASGARHPPADSVAAPRAPASATSATSPPATSPPVGSALVAPGPASPGVLAEELRLVAQLRAADSTGDDVAVIRTAAEYRRTVAGGGSPELARRVEAYAIGARCRAGQPTARADAEAWLAQNRGAVVLADHLRARCMIEP